MAGLEVVMQHDFLLFSRCVLVILLYVIACRMPSLIGLGYPAILVSILLLYKYFLELMSPSSHRKYFGLMHRDANTIRNTIRQ